MASRKSHSKSKRGCLTCKKRHVKCDELGPPCANCVVRKTSCSYGDGDDVDTGGPSPAVSSGLAPGTTPTTAADVPPEQPPSPPGPRRLLELELMHRWTAVTWKSMCCIAEEQDIMQMLIPRDALRYDFLMDAILAVAALDMAHELGADAPSRYGRAALEYYDHALRSLHAELGRGIDQENYLAVFIGSLMIGAISVHAPKYSRDAADKSMTALETTYLLFDMMKGNQSVVVTCLGYIVKGPIRMDAWDPVGPLHLLDEGTKSAMARLRRLNDQAHPDSVSGDQDGGYADILSQEPHTAYRSAIKYLEDIYARDMDGKIKAACIAWPGFSGPYFMTAIRRSEPLALLILMHWAVLMHRLGRDTWWAEGQDLVDEITAMFRSSQLSPSDELKASINWAREQSDLPPLR